MQAAWGGVDHRGDTDNARDTLQTGSQGRVWNNLASPLLPCRLPPITDEEWPVAKSKWKPVGQGAWEILFAGTSPSLIPLYPVTEKKVGEEQGINLKANRFP